MLMCSASYLAASAEVIHTAPTSPALRVKVSKMGLNRISNFPYRIVQVTGDENAYRLKSDDDGANIYLHPLKNVGEKIEISIKNNIGTSYDLELEVANTKGQIINLQTQGTDNSVFLFLKSDLEQMLKCMKQERHGKFYVKNSKTKLAQIGNLSAAQEKIYKWKDLSGGVFIVTNLGKKVEELNLKAFTSRFDNVLTSFSAKTHLMPLASTKVFIIQKAKE